MSADDFAWWLDHETGSGNSRAASLALADLLRIEMLEAHRRVMDRTFVRWYGDARYNGYSTTGPMYPSPDNYDEDSSNENTIRKVVVDLHNKFAKNRPVPTCITTGGTYKERRDAQEREQWVRGCFEADKVYELLALGQFHSMFFCDGFVGVRDNYQVGRPTAYQMAPYEIHLDPPTGEKGKPRVIYWVGSEDRDVMAAYYPEFADDIEHSSLFFEELWNVKQWNSDTRRINFIEAWHLESKPGFGDGRHIIALKNATILNEPWPHDYFPFVKIPWNPRPFGYFSVGLIEDLIGPQRQLNRSTNAIDEHLRMLSSSFWAIPRAANVVKAAISNLIGRAIEFTGAQPPALVTPQPVSPDLWKRQDALRQQIFAQSGRNQLAAQGMTPPGLTSGKALRIYANLEDEQFVNADIAKETAVVELANLYAKRAQAMLENDRERGKLDLTVRLTNNSRLKEIEWKDADLDSFKFQTLPASALSTTLAGKMQDVQDLEDAGIVTDVDQKRELLQIPDLKAESDLTLAPRNRVLRALELILEDGENAPDLTPEPYWPPDTCATLGLQMLCKAELEEYPDKTIQLLRNWVNECVARKQPPAPPAQQAQPDTQSGAPVPPGPIGDQSAPPGPNGGLPVPTGQNMGAVA